ncbi:MAG TPA: hypothetical protein VK638_31115 [Edaphobacter sp.]|nr:hypothetical protein [Edaphobacter sp.]
MTKTRLAFAAAVVTAVGGCAYLGLLFVVIFGLHVMWMASDMAWYLGFIVIGMNCIALITVREKRFLLFVLVGLLLISAGGYVRNGGENTPLPYPASSR